MTCEEFITTLNTKSTTTTTVAERAALVRHMEGCPSCFAQIRQHFQQQPMTEAERAQANAELAHDERDPEWVETAYGDAADRAEADRAECKRTGRHYCEPGSPWPGSGSSYHPHAVVIEELGGHWPAERMKCPVCGHVWFVPGCRSRL